MLRKPFYLRRLPTLFLGVALSLGQLSAAERPKYQPEKLVDLMETVGEASVAGKDPVVIFDLDDTLINTRERNFRIIKDFILQSDIESRFPEEVAKIQYLKLVEIKYLLKDTLAGLGITNQAFVDEANAFWLNTFFTNEYCASDKPNRGAVRYVNTLYNLGGTIVYLTGRDVPRMETGTRSNLRALGFPLDGTRARLVMKPSKDGDDLAFKLSQLDDISKLGEVVGQFENEPANANAIAERLPDVLSIFLDTIHSPKPIEPKSGIYWVGDFKLPN